MSIINSQTRWLAGICLHHASLWSSYGLFDLATPLLVKPLNLLASTDNFSCHNQQSNSLAHAFAVPASDPHMVSSISPLFLFSLNLWISWQALTTSLAADSALCMAFFFASWTWSSTATDASSSANPSETSDVFRWGCWSLGATIWEPSQRNAG